MKYKKYWGLDFETYCDVDLPKAGFDRYIHDPSFQPLIASVDYGLSMKQDTWDFVFQPEKKIEFVEMFMDAIDNDDVTWVAHNVGFERGVLKWMGVPDSHLSTMLDSAVISRCHGAASSLEAAAPQLTHINKLEVGRELIMLFSVPNEKNGGKPFSKLELMTDLDLYKKWNLYKEYCEMDALGGREIAELYNEEEHYDTATERDYEWLTHTMNVNGWNVDLPLVQEMQTRFEENVDAAKAEFLKSFPKVTDKFFNSHKQLKEFCEVRGIKASSFSADALSQLIPKIEAALPKVFGTYKHIEYSEVLHMLKTKQTLGGSSLTKLKVLLDTTGTDGRLRNQYMHCGAGQTYRTSARGVQLQNLKRLNEDLFDMETLYSQDTVADNDLLAANLRQVFTAGQLNGRLIVGDFSSVESRGLAWLSGEDWKIDAYREKKDIYKVLASKFSGVPYEDITKEARKEGKYSELSCGYQAAGQAVKDFMHALGFEVSLAGAEERVRNWRDANPAIVETWEKIDVALHTAVSSRARGRAYLAHNLMIEFTMIPAPASLLKQHPGIQSMVMTFSNVHAAVPIFERTFHGVYERGRSICYYKPTDRKTGNLWNADYINPKTKKRQFYSIYGGKLAGIATQSLCREMFFHSLELLYKDLRRFKNVMLVGQFHDEIVVEWRPQRGDEEAVSLENTKIIMEIVMSKVSPALEGFPLTAEIKDDYRYTK